MIFGATFACARCRLRFPRRSQCPSCKSAEIVALSTRDGRARYRAATRTKVGAGRAVLIALAPWAPRRAYIAIGFALLAMAPAAIAIGFGPHMFQDLWIMDDLSTEYRGISHRGYVAIVSCISGLLLLAFTMLAKVGVALAERTRGTAPVRMRVLPADAPRGATTLTGIARRATVEIDSPISGVPCLLFGVAGEVGDADVADADGGDFDLELRSGERVMISLEHAALVVHGEARRKEPLKEVGTTLEELLENRCIMHEDRTVLLAEHVVRDGDEVTVTGKVLGGKVTSLGRGTSGTRVLAGDEEQPLVVEVGAAR